MRTRLLHCCFASFGYHKKGADSGVLGVAEEDHRVSADTSVLAVKRLVFNAEFSASVSRTFPTSGPPPIPTIWFPAPPSALKSVISLARSRTIYSAAEPKFPNPVKSKKVID
jgi:hypothetical protein